MLRRMRDTTGRGDSSEGVRQGDAASAALFCAGIHDEVVQLDLTLSASGGFARFYMDDGICHGPAEHIFDAIVTFIRESAAQTGCTVSSVQLYSPDYDLSTYVPAPSAGSGRGRDTLHHWLEASRLTVPSVEA